MRASFAVLLGLALLPGGFVHAARAQEAVYVVTYIEVMPSATAQAIALLKELGAATQKEAGNLRFEAVEEVGRADRLAMLETWKDRNAFEAHGSAGHMASFRERLRAIQNSPPDERVHGGLLVAGEPGAGGLWVLTHVDVVPPRKDDAVGLLRELGEASRKDGGNLLFDVVQQASRPNHFTVVELWRDRAAFEAHGMAPHTRQFRTSLAPMGGSLYDERLYKAVE